MITAVLTVAALGAPSGCYLQVIPDYTLGVIYRPVLRPSPDCPADVSLRVRKTSTLSRKRDGASYQPIIPDGSERYGGVYSWTLGRFGSTVPSSALWTLYTWRWQYELEPGSNVWRYGWTP